MDATIMDAINGILNIKLIWIYGSILGFFILMIVIMIVDFLWSALFRDESMRLENKKPGIEKDPYHKYDIPNQDK